MVRPLIDPQTVYQAALGAVVPQQTIGQRAFGAVRALVLRVYPVGHEANPTGQTVADIQPLADMPILMGVPLGAAHAHQETGVAGPQSANRQPYEPKARNRAEGSVADVRPGTYVWVQFVNGSLYDPVITGSTKFGQGDEAPNHVDRIAADGTLTHGETRALDGDAAAYPRKVSAFNGCRDEIDNRGNRMIRTSTDRAPVFPGHNGIKASPDPEGSFGVSTRGAAAGHIGFTTGRHPTRENDTSKGRQFRATIGADDGSIRDETDSGVGHMIHRIKGGEGRYFVSTKGANDGRVYLEDGDNYLALGPRAELHGDSIVLDGGTVRLGSAGAGDAVVLWPQLKAILSQLWAAIDGHTHTGVETGAGTSGPPTAPTFAATWNGQADQCKASDVLAAPANAPAPSYQDDPEAT